jgi:hypothetical protein
MKTTPTRWQVGDHCTVAGRRGTVRELFESGAFVHALVVEYDDEPGSRDLVGQSGDQRLLLYVD